MTDLIMQTGNVLIPIVSLGITNSILRFGLEKGSDNKCVFTTGLAVIALGEVLLAAFYPLLSGVGLMGDYAVLLLLYVFMANLHSLFGSMAQALGKVRIYAVQRHRLHPCCSWPSNVLLLSVFRMGIAGYILSNVIADAPRLRISLLRPASSGRYFSPASIRRDVVRSMLRYCLPLIPATVCSWIINISDPLFYLLHAGRRCLRPLRRGEQDFHHSCSYSPTFSHQPGSSPPWRAAQKPSAKGFLLQRVLGLRGALSCGRRRAHSSVAAHHALPRGSGLFLRVALRARAHARHGAWLPGRVLRHGVYG